MKEPEDVTKEQLIRDLTELRSRITELERSEEDKRKYQEELTRTRAMFEGLFEFAPDAIIVVGRGGEIIRVNKQAEKLFGYSRNELTDLHHEILLPERFREIHEEHRRKYMSGPRIRPMGTGLELYGRKKDGSEFSVDIALGPLKAGDDIVVMAVIRDVSERKQAEEALSESEYRFRGIAATAPDAVIIMDDDGKVSFWNEAATKLFGYTSGEALGEYMHLLVVPEHLRESYKKGFEVFRVTGEGPYVGALYEIEAIRKDGTAFPVELSLAALKIKEKWHSIGIVRDITERKRMEEEIRHLAHHDTLTGLPNRRLFRDIADLELAQARRNRRKLAILFLDLDRFKEINDTLGHDVGDELLKQAAGMFRETVRASDTVARIGGDEFNIILADIARPEDVSDIAQKIIRRFRSPFSISGNELNVTTSIGISVYPDDSTEIDTLLRYADIAMYHAKESGRNTFRFYNSAINVRSLERMRFENMLRRSIAMGELVIYYQPQVDIQNRRMICAEALVRWQHPEKGFLTPDRFLAQAEDTGFITEIDEWVLKTVCAQVRSWIDSDLAPVCVTVNLSARQFEKPDLVYRIAAILKETGMEPDCLDLEVTESTAMGDVGQTASQLRELRDMGVHVSIDDFGTGYSSLNYLKKLPIERIKIDKSFIQDIVNDPDDRAIISAVTSMARKMGIKTVAEGVETEEQLAFLRSADCDEAQGYLFSRPLPAEKFRELITKAA